MSSRVENRRRDLAKPWVGSAPFGVLGQFYSLKSCPQDCADPLLRARRALFEVPTKYGHV